MIRLRQIKVNIEDEQTKTLLKKISKLLKVEPSKIKNYTLIKKSLDARKKDELFYVYEVDVEVDNEKEILKKNKSKDIFISPDETYIFPEKNDIDQPIIIGCGPAGLFCAYILAEQGYKPIIYERGEKVEDRVKTIEEFWKTNKLNKNSNVQFGEGGAGTFSDGKLNTLVKDKAFRGKKVFEIFVENGAPEEIMYLNNPHIGTDLLRQVIINMREKILSLGGTINYNSTLTDLVIENNTLQAIKINDEIIPCKNLVLAIGHSARDTFEMLYQKNLEMSAKPFAVGVRIEHPQELINKSQYGEKYYDILPPASYKLTYQTKNNRGVYSFCMCPGGYVVNASSEENRLAVNGMSNHARDTKNANSALVVTISPDDFGTNPLDGMYFQRELEEKAYNEGNGLIPVQLYKDYKDNIKSKEIGSIEVITKGNYNLANLNNIFPDYINESLKEAIEEFNKKINGYSNDDVPLLGVESRTSSPIKITRDEFGLSNIKGIYPCGEGCGYAGGITTAAMDGLKTAEYLVKKEV